ncbi:MAG: RNA-binding protein [Candidatus Dojkabacteria bacterium]|nr:RNA-binding protein [Candidatus Dojkabacteria bacterium]
MDPKKLFVGNLSYSTTQEALEELFSQYGEIENIYKPAQKGFAFVTFKTEEAAKAAMEAQNGQPLDGRELRIDFARPREERPRNDFRSQGQY